MIIVTGGAGFIGSCIVARLNAEGREDLIVVDHLEGNPQKQENLRNKKYKQYFDKTDFLVKIRNEQWPVNIESVIHMGACSSTTLQDAAYFQKNNYEYSCYVAQWALKRRARFIYASSAATYGDGGLGYSDADEMTYKLKPLNLYGESKQKFDVWILNNGLINKVVGLKFFNVFGPNEYHKGEMRSVVAKSHTRAVEEGKMVLFKSYKSEYADGEQKRDFIYVKDAVDIVKYFLKYPDINGIYNVGTGQARSWNELSRALFAAIGKPARIEYIDMPIDMRPCYQYFTQADMSKLRQRGYSQAFTSLESAVKDYVSYLKTGSCI